MTDETVGSYTDRVEDDAPGTFRLPTGGIKMRDGSNKARLEIEAFRPTVDDNQDHD